MKMKKKKVKAKPPVHLMNRLNDLESRAADIGLTVHYDLMEAAGLKLNGGLCRIRGKLHLFIDRRASAVERIAAIESSIEQIMVAPVEENAGKNDQVNTNEPDK
jgi:hypothetical protein